MTKYINVGIASALEAVKKTLLIYKNKGLSPREVRDIIQEIDQQLALKEIKIQLS